MNALPERIPRLFDKSGAVGTIVAAMGCASCFPALGALGAALGLGFLAQFEGLFINTLLPLLAAIVAASNLWAWWRHRRHLRLAVGLAGPAMVLATLYLFWTDNWSTSLFYAGLVVMTASSIWDLVSPPRRACATTDSQTNGECFDKKRAHD